MPVDEQSQPTKVPSGTENGMSEVSRHLDHDNLSLENFCGSGLRVHEVAGMLPLIAGSAFDDLCQDVKAMGLINSITVKAGVILDGRNRLRACVVAGIEPRYAEYDGAPDREAEWIISQNVQRRSLDPNQRAAFIVMSHDWINQKKSQLEKLRESGKEGGRGNKKKGPLNSTEAFSSNDHDGTRRILAKEAGVSIYKVVVANSVRSRMPRLLPLVVSGEISLREAQKQALAVSLPNARATARTDRNPASKSYVDGRAPRRELGGISLIEFIEQLLKEIHKRRLANQEYQKTTKWNPTKIKILEQYKLMNWVVGQLKTIIAADPDSKSGSSVLTLQPLEEDASYVV